MRNVKVNRLELPGKCFIFTPPMSNEVHAFVGGSVIEGRATSMTGPAVEEGWLAEAPAVFGDDCAVPSCNAGLPVSSATLFVSGGLLGLVMGIADLVTVRDAIALARALWCRPRDALII